MTNPENLDLRPGTREAAARQRAEEALRGSELRYRRLFEAAQDGILLLDAVTGTITDANPFIIDLLGFSHAEMVNKKLWEIGAFRDVFANLDKFKELQDKGYVRYDGPCDTGASYSYFLLREPLRRGRVLP